MVGSLRICFKGGLVMNNTEKLLRAFIEAQGFNIEKAGELKNAYKREDIQSSGEPKVNALPNCVIDNTYFKIVKKGNLFTLTDNQLEKLQDVLDDHCDCGPRNEGWASSELNELVEVFANEKI